MEMLTSKKLAGTTTATKTEFLVSALMGSTPIRTKEAAAKNLLKVEAGTLPEIQGVPNKTIKGSTMRKESMNLLSRWEASTTLELATKSSTKIVQQTEAITT